MPDTIPADASPEKRLFISLLTRDISLIAAFLDLIDNSVNAALEPHAHRLVTADDYLSILDDSEVQPDTDIDVRIADDSIFVSDTAPGISLATARKHVFRFGRPDDSDQHTDRLSVYGLGLKRAFFKAGERVDITSDHVEGGFELHLDIQQWARDGRTPWQFDLTPRTPVTHSECGTKIVISHLYPDMARRLNDGLFIGQLGDQIGTTYSYFLSKFVHIHVNGDRVQPISLRVGSNTATDHLEADGVTCTVTAGLGTRAGDRYRDSGSGWFIFCNGRTVISADKSALTGWQNNGLPIFQPKHRPFLGTVYFVSKYSDRLPWDTTKSDIDQDSAIWQQAKRLMVAVGRSVVSFLDSRYSDEGTDVVQSDLDEAAGQRVEVIRASLGVNRAFRRPQAPTRTTVRIQYMAKIEHVELIGDYLSRPGITGSEVGRHTFFYFLRNEVGED